MDKRKHLNSYGSQKKGIADLKRFASARVYLQNNNLETIADLQGKISQLQSKNRKVSKEIKTKTEEIDKLNKCLVYADIIRKTKPVFDKWQGKKLFKENYYKEYKEMIDKYQRVRTYLEKQTGSSAIKPKEWRKRISQLEDEIESLNKAKTDIKDEFSKINHIKYAVKIVNDDYGIDLSIEIDKAIKKGEKPSIIEQIKKFEKQQEKDDRYRKKAREKYQSKEER